MLTARECVQARPQEAEYRLNDGHGLHLLIRTNGKKVWRFRYQIKNSDGRPENKIYTIGEHLPAAPLGETPEQQEARIAGGRVTLAEARIARDRARALVKQGINPTNQRQRDVAQRRADEGYTVDRLVQEWMARQAWRPSTRSARQWTWGSVGRPFFGDMPVKTATAPMIFDALRRVSETAPPHTLHQLRRILHAAFRGAVEAFHITENPVHAWRDAFPRPPRESRRPMTLQEIGQLLRDAAAPKNTLRQPHPQSILALRLMWWSLCRIREVTDARWSEIDLDTGAWKIPGARMKAGRDHVLWLPVQAIAALRTHRASARDDYVFPSLIPGSRSGSMDPETVRNMIELAGWKNKFIPHMVRHTGRTILGELGYAWDVMEAQLSHVLGNSVERAYNYAEHRAARQKMMQTWADMLDELENGAPELLEKWERRRAAGHVEDVQETAEIRVPDDPLRAELLRLAHARIMAASYRELNEMRALLVPADEKSAPAETPESVVIPFPLAR